MLAKRLHRWLLEARLESWILSGQLSLIERRSNPFPRTVLGQSSRILGMLAMCFRLGLWLFGLTKHGTLWSRFSGDGVEISVAKLTNGAEENNSFRWRMRSLFDRKSKS